MDPVLNLLQLTPFRCRQCLHRFVRFRNAQARIVFFAVLCLIPLVLLAAWFIELRTLRPAAPVTTQNAPLEPAGTVVPKKMNEILSRQPPAPSSNEADRGAHSK